MANVPVVLEARNETLLRAGEACRGAFHVLTNSRALPPARARTRVARMAAAARRAFPDARLVLRGDSTLRAHLLEEYHAVSGFVSSAARPVLLLVPALPSAGRVTLGGIQLVERSGRRVPLHETEYAVDGIFAYRDSHLLAWAEERSKGFFRAEDGCLVGLAELRARGAEAVATALDTAARRGRPAVCAPDAETVADLALIADGLARAEAAGVPVLVRCGPTFAGVLSGTLAEHRVAAPHASRGALVVCGSYVPNSTRQLERVVSSYPGVLSELDVGRALGDAPEQEAERLSTAATRSLRGSRLAVVSTPRERLAGARSLPAGMRIASVLAHVVRRLADEVDIVVFKGGITSAVGVRHGLQVRLATVVGPVADGLALWQARRDRKAIVFPGNVGDEGALLRLVEEIVR